MHLDQQERIRILPTLIEREKNHEKAIELAAELAALLELEMQERRQRATAELPGKRLAT
jgi:uncharacterized protein (UPF0276 family)